MIHHLHSFEAEKNRKALAYTAIICIVLMLLFYFISWKNEPASTPIVEEFEINLGNDMEGWGQEQPLIKGKRNNSPDAEKIAATSISKSIEAENVRHDDNADDAAAPITKPEKISKAKVETNVTSNKVVPPAKPKQTYAGPGSGHGNNENEDNQYQNQGNNRNGVGDAGSPTGDKDSYGNTPGGKIGGPKVIRGTRKIVRYYSFTGDLPKATIYAVIKVSPDGRGTFVSFEKGSTSRNQGYADSIKEYLRNIQFDKASTESNVTVEFKFNIK